ncbi:hypothetical protein TVAG_300560 [Trichomonas vaginalis G3]|uniref:Uncharacterized protein n=1 Tax=Trichomonas vaginalis (strain ATCC PRA-98 / G3) TaxID=412133 RepID=A2EP36_TRIV3|nr:hypothetical protein TVAGG3_0155210 [Trichomonas vaginalis G3]EAY05574.1 hypothetical protein TVAG_300560 [Trichomonas vaginalis G3]KAI5547522.1 hypothetical protein TVAGG3_0155210 [Trichomonas vaginalis G3]|eukprot:XP_001317797.1 hypothetical protein [Trichomonas vaginalis G3]
MLFLLSALLFYSPNLRPLDAHSNLTDFFNPDFAAWNVSKMENKVSALSLLGPSDEEFKDTMNNVSIIVGSVAIGTLFIGFLRRHSRTQ